MPNKGKIRIKGIVQGVGFRPFVYATAKRLSMRGTVKNLGSEVVVTAWGDSFDEFARLLSGGTPLSVIDSVETEPLAGDGPDDFVIVASGEGARSGFVPTDVAICEECITDIFESGGRYEGYWATSCVNCGPRYSIIREVPYDRVRTTMDTFPMCADCESEYTDPESRRHHAQTIACDACGPSLALLAPDGTQRPCNNPIAEAARLLDDGAILTIRGVGGFHLACVEESAAELKRRLGRTEQPLAVMALLQAAEDIADISPDERAMLTSPARPVVVLDKKNPDAHSAVSNLHTLGIMLPYTGLHHLLLTALSHPFLIMTSANVPGYPMITETQRALEELGERVDWILTHNRVIHNRCDDSVVRKGTIIRLSRGFAPKRHAEDLGDHCILGVGPELNANITIYKDGFCLTSPHVGNVRNPGTLAYLEETIETIGQMTGAAYDIIAHDLHPQFLSTRLARRLASECGATLVPVQHHHAHIASVTTDPCIGIAIDGVGYGTDGTVWGGEIFAGSPSDYQRVGHLETVAMPGGDLATKFPERMLYGILPDDETIALLTERGWNTIETGVLAHQIERGVNVAHTSSTGRVLDAAAALLGICREKTYDGEPAMKLESVARAGTPQTWDLCIEHENGADVLKTSRLLATARNAMGTESPATLAASIQHNLARGIAEIAKDAAREHGYETVALSGGVAYNEAIRTTIQRELEDSGLTVLIPSAYPLGDGCISYGQCRYVSKI